MWKTLVRFETPDARFLGMYETITMKFKVDTVSDTSFWVYSNVLPIKLFDRFMRIQGFIEVRARKEDAD